jgi:hypothetical protein
MATLLTRRAGDAASLSLVSFGAAATLAPGGTLTGLGIVGLGIKGMEVSAETAPLVGRMIAPLPLAGEDHKLDEPNPSISPNPSHPSISPDSSQEETNEAPPALHQMEVPTDASEEEVLALVTQELNRPNVHPLPGGVFRIRDKAYEIVQGPSRPVGTNEFSEAMGRAHDEVEAFRMGEERLMAEEAKMTEEAQASINRHLVPALQEALPFAPPSALAAETRGSFHLRPLLPAPRPLLAPPPPPPSKPFETLSFGGTPSLSGPGGSGSGGSGLAIMFPILSFGLSMCTIM